MSIREAESPATPGSGRGLMGGSRQRQDPEPWETQAGSLGSFCAGLLIGKAGQQGWAARSRGATWRLFPGLTGPPSCLGSL